MDKILIIKHVEVEGPGTLVKFLDEAGVEYKILDIFKKDNSLFLRGYERYVSGVVILGGPMNVYEEAKYPFLSVEKNFIWSLINEKIPVLGICLGAQLIASVLGAKVHKALLKEIGWYDIRLTAQAKQDLLFKGLSGDLKVFQWHGDTFDLPKDAILLATGNSMNQAFCVNNTAWGFQFHIEVDSDMIHSWCKSAETENNLSLDSCHAFIKEHEHIKNDFDTLARSIYQGFLQKILHSRV